MDSYRMDMAWYYNIFEGFLWMGFSVVFAVPAVRRQEKHRGFCVLGALAFLTASASEFVEAKTGAWWLPWWLVVWKASYVGWFIVMVLWYMRIVPDWREKVFGKGKGTP